MTQPPPGPRAIGGSADDQPPIRADDTTAMPACPFVGRVDDPALVGTMAAAEHRCYKPPSPHRVRTDVQGRFCLSARYQRCPVYRGVLAAPPGPSLNERLFQGGVLRFLGTREGLAFVFFAMLIPAAIGVAFAVIDDDGTDPPAPSDPVSLSDISAQPGTDAIDPTLPAASAEDAQAAAQTVVPVDEPAAEAPAQAEPEVVEPDPNLSPREQLLAWTNLTERDVQPGDNLGVIAAEYDTTIEAIAVYNGIDDINNIAIGQRLIVPIGFTTPVEIQQTSSGTDGPPPAVLPTPSDALLAWPDVVEWAVGPGDSLFLISIDFATSVDAIAALNSIDPATPLQVGQLLQIPQGFLEP